MKNFLQVNRALAAENNFYLNLNQLPSKNDGEPTVNRQSRLMLRHGKRSENGALSSTCLRSASVPLSFRSRYLRYAAVIFCVLVMSVGQAWADNVTISADEMVAGDTKSHITPDAGAEAVVSEQQVWLDGSTKKKYNCLQLSSASGTSEVLGALKTKSVFFTVDDGYKITGFTVSGASNKDASTTAPIVMACWTGDVSRTPALIAQITLPDRQTSSLPSIVASSIPAGTKTIALYRRVKVDNTTTPTELVSSSGYDYGSGNTGNIVSVTITYEAAASTKRIYMKAGAWNGSSPKFYVHSWLDSDNNTEEMALADCETDVYYADIPSTHTGLLFTRQDPSSTGLDWTYSDNSGKLWNQSEDIIIGSNDKFTFSSWGTGDGHPKSSFSGGTYSAPTYTISYAAGTGSGTMSSQTGIACGTDKATTSNTFTAPSGYNFTGWKANVGVKVGGSTKTAGTLLDDGVTIQDISSNITLTAQWEEEVTYSVTYNANGATGSVPTDASSPYSTGATVTVLGKNTLAKTDNGFAGWRTATSSGTWYVPGETFAMGSANVNLSAQWVAEASLVSGTLYQAANLKSAALTSTSAESDRYRAGISSNGVSEILGTGIANATAGPMEYNTISSTTVGDASFTSVLYFKGTGSGSPSATGTTIPTSRSIKFRVPSKGTLHLYVKGPGSISLIKSGGTAAVIGSGDANAYVTTDVTAGTYYLFATASSRSLYGLKFVEESCSATQPGTIGKGTLSGCTLRLTAAGSPASNNTWYWQSSEDGIDKSESGATKDVTSTGTYYIRSYCTTGSGCWSDARSVTVSASDLTPAAPTNFTAGSISATGATFTIADAGNASSYDIYYSTSSTAPTSDVTITSTSKSKAVTGLTFNTTYYAWVRAVCGSNKSDWVALSGSTFTTSNAAPTSASISPSNGWIYVPGETITLTASAETTNASTTYTWYRGATIEAAKAAGVIQAARTAAAGGTTYTIASCKAADAYKYWVEISNGTGYETSTSYDIKIYTFFLYDNTPSEIGDYTFSTIDRVNNKISVTIPLSNINYTYQFKVSDGLGTWYGCNDATITGSHAYWDGLNSTGDNVGLTSSFADDYKIDYYYNSNNVVVTYPVHNQAEDVKVYFDNRLTEMENMYIRIGHDANSKASSAFTLVPGTANLYVGTTTSFNDFHAWSIADNTGWTGSNTIYQPWNDGGVNKPDNEYAITKQTNYQRYVVDETISIIPTSENNTEYGCTYWNVDKVSGMKTDRVTISDYSNGTITVNYVDTEEEEASFTSGYADLAHTVKLTSITAVPNTGYDAGAITINDDAYETNYVVTANTTIAASFTPHVYSITYLDKGGSAFSGSHADGYPTTHTYATATTLKTASKTGYTFDGWYGNSACTGAPMTSIGATSITADITLYAKWTAAASLTALECNTLYKVPDMIPSGASLTSSDQFFDGLSTNTKFELIGSGSDETTPKVNNSSSNDKTIDGITFDDGSMWFKGTASLTSNIPTTFGLSFIVPEGGGKLYLYFSGTSTNIKLAKSGEAGSKPSCPNGYGAVDVTAGTYYLYGTGTSAPYCFYGLKLCSTYSVSITTNNTTKTSGETGSTAAVNGKAYTAIFTANTGYTLPSDVTVTIGDVAQTEGTGYTWTVSDGTGTLTIPAAKVTGAIAISVSGIAAATYTVTYNAQGGSVTPSSETVSTATLPTPTHASLTFDGWYKTDGTKVTAPFSPTGDITLYARWSETCSGGGGGGSDPVLGIGVSEVTTSSFLTTYVTEGITISSDQSWVSDKNIDGAVVLESSGTYNTNYLEVLSSEAAISKVSFLLTGNGTDKSLQPVVFGWATSASSASAATYRILEAETVSNKGYTNAEWFTYDFSESNVKCIHIYKNSKNISSADPAYTGSSTALGGSNTIWVYGVKIWLNGSGGSSSACHKVLYHGNGATSGYIYDPAVYDDGDGPTVLGNVEANGVPFVKAGQTFQGWAEGSDHAPQVLWIIR